MDKTRSEADTESLNKIYVWTKIVEQSTQYIVIVDINQ